MPDAPISRAKLARRRVKHYSNAATSKASLRRERKIMFGLGRRQPQWPVTPGAGADEHLRESFDLLRTKWGEIPHGELHRVRSEKLLELSDEQLLLDWSRANHDASTGKAHSVRGW